MTGEHTVAMEMEGRLAETALDPADPNNHPLLSELQGNILKSHGRSFTVHLFLRFKPDVTAARAWLRSFAETSVTSALDQYDSILAYRDCREHYQQQGRSAAAYRSECGTELFANVLLSAAGYRALGFAEDDLPPDKRFRLGMKHPDTRAWLHDPPSETWEDGFREEIHALLVLAHSSDPEQETEFRDALEQITAEVSSVADIVATDYGRAIRHNGQVVEHFGFVDGISQPLFLVDEVERLGPRGWDASAPLGLVLARDPNGQTHESYGSYIVYRKLAQDVQQFNDLVEKLAAQAGIDPELAGAYVVGRFKDGTPLSEYDCPAFSDEASGADRGAWNTFDYRKDVDAARCPFHSHIRKVNPRGEKHFQMLPSFRRFVAQRRWLLALFPKLREELAEMEHMERSNRIVRRGITYGPEQPADGEEVGVLFMCAQADIARQFEFIQSIWANKNTFIRDGVGLDPIAGQGPQQHVGQAWPRQWGDPRPGQERFDISRCTTLRGGEYFFAPSISFLSSV